jgi:photosystem II stability/assembly factor-like uncharacterized protein
MKNKLIVAALLGWLGVFNFQLTTMAQTVATTLAATSIGQTNATLNGTVNPNGTLAAAYFQYGLTTNYDNLGGYMALPVTNTAQTLPGLVVNSLQEPAGANWIQTSVPGTVNGTNLSSIASSADGLRLAAVVSVGGIYTSTNGGVTWIQTSAPVKSWMSIASSADGLRLAAAELAGSVYTSTNGGVTWTPKIVSFNSLFAIASSADGTRLAVAAQPGPIYTSTNSGNTWTQSGAPSSFVYWKSIASSADGTRLIAGSGTISGSIGYVYTSVDSGATWVQTAMPGGNWYSVAASADGWRLAATDYLGGIYLIVNGGYPFPTPAPSNLSWNSISCSADGSRLAATARNGGIYTSTNGGNNWTQTSAPTTNDWTAIASSADGSRLAAAVYFHGTVPLSGIYTSTGATTNLLPGMTYHYRVAGLSVVTSVGNDQTFTTLAGAPTATTSAASNVTATNTTLNGSITTGGFDTKAYFQYGLTTNYGSYSATNTLAATNIFIPVSNLISNLATGMTYHFQLVASNSAGVALGGDLTFLTPGQPIVTDMPATSIAANSAILNAAVNPMANLTTAYFQYGLTTNYGNGTPTITLPATNTILNISAPVTSLLGASGTNWTQTGAPNVSWYSIAASADGSRLAAVVDGGGIYTSMDGGSTWTQTSAPNASWHSIAASPDGTHLAAAVYAGYIYISKNGGISWTQTGAPSAAWNSLTYSADGSRLAAVVNAGSIYTSTNSGSTWTQTSAPNKPWISIAGSSDGLRLAAVVYTYPSPVYTTTDGGTTWISNNVPGAFFWRLISSTDGTRLTAIVYGGGIYTSTNGGSTWTPTSAPTKNWVSIAGSADGSQLAAAVYGGGIYTSTNSGSTWTLTGAPATIWYSIASSADGTPLAAGVKGGGIYIPTRATSNLMPATTYHYRTVGYNVAGFSYGDDLTFTTLAQAVNFGLNGVTQLPGGAFQFSFTNLDGLSFTVLGATNLMLPLSNWTVLGAPVEAPPAQYQFIDPQATNSATQFYRVRSP